MILHNLNILSSNCVRSDRPAFLDGEIANDKVGQLLLVRVRHVDVFVVFDFALGRRPVLDAHNLEQMKTNQPLAKGEAFGRPLEAITLIKSNVLVNMTMQLAFTCHTNRQKSATVRSLGPCVTTYAFGFSILCTKRMHHLDSRRAICSYESISIRHTNIDIASVVVILIWNSCLKL